MDTAKTGRELFPKRLSQAMRARGLDQESLAKMMPTTPATVSRWVHGKTHPEQATASLLAIRLGVPVEWLVRGADEIELLAGTPPAALASDGALKSLIELGYEISPRVIDPTVAMPGATRTRNVPLLSWAAAGTMTNAAALDESFDGTGVASTVPGRAFAVEIAGDSMYPEINPGDYAVVRADAPARAGQVVLVRTINGDVWCKRFTTRDRGQLVILSSVNKSYEPIEIPASEIAWIYPVKQVIRNY